MKTKNYLLILLTLCTLFVCSCSKGDDGVGSGNPNAPGKDLGKDNKTDLCVTGGIETVGMTYANILGYVNLSSAEILAIQMTGDFGVEYGISESNLYQRISSTQISNGQFITNLKYLQPNTKYYYRCYYRTGNTYEYAKQIASFTTNSTNVDIRCRLTYYDLQYYSTNIKNLIEFGDNREYFNNEYYHLAVAMSKDKQKLENNLQKLYDKAQFSSYSDDNKEALEYGMARAKAEVDGVIFFRNEHYDIIENKALFFFTDELEAGTTYYLKGFIDIGGKLLIPQETTTMITKSLDTNEYFETKRFKLKNTNEGATGVFDGGTNYYGSINFSSTSPSCGLPSSLLNMLPPATELAEDLNACGKSNLYVNDKFVGVILSYGYYGEKNKTFLPAGKYLTSSYESYKPTSFAYYTYYNRILVCYNPETMTFSVEESKQLLIMLDYPLYRARQIYSQ